jgi:drug/metabolite transporter (DMT)-like permease
MSRHHKAYALLLLTTLLWGGNAIAGKFAVGQISPMVLVFLRWVLAILILLPFAGPKLREDWPVARRHLPLLAGLGACGFALFNIIFYVALNYTTAINVSIEQAGMPILIIVGNFLFFRIRAGWLQILGVILTVAGVVLTASHGNPVQLLRLDVNFGDAIMLVAIVLYSGYSVALRLKPALQWQSLILILSISALIASVPFAAWEAAAGKAQFPGLVGWAIALYTALCASVISQVAYIRGNELIGANRAGLFINLVPIFGTLLSIMVLGEDFHLYHAVALTLVFGGIWLAEHSSRRLADRMPATGVRSSRDRA